MFTLKEELKKLLVRYSMVYRKLNSRKESVSEGKLEITSRNQFYIRARDPKSGKIVRTYIKKSEIKLAKELAQKAYEQRLKKLVHKRIVQLQEICKDFEDDEIDKMYDDNSDLRKELIRPIIPTRDNKLNKWLSIEYKGLGFHDDRFVIMTNRKQRVRSKSEKIMANIFDEYGLSYKYECPLITKNGKIFYPDFTFFNTRTNEEIYWEHFGKMDDSDYLDKALRKIEDYSKADILIGRNLIVTFESSKCNISDESIVKLIRGNLI